MRVTMLDLGVGNLHSLGKALDRAIPHAVVSTEQSVELALRAELLVLPGVGAWGAVSLGDARVRLRAALDDGKPCIGICLGMQLLFETSEEAAGDGIGFFGGAVTRLTSPRAPHMGWSRVVGVEAEGMRVPAAAYFAHSFACRPADSSTVCATTSIEGDELAVVVKKNRTIGCQFHPEKSSDAGIAFLRDIVQRLVTP